jgi:hypothetical protein
MDFRYIAGVGIFKQDFRIEEKIKAGFYVLDEAQKYIERLRVDSFGTRAYFIDGPEGRYIYGDADKHMWEWYKPGEKGRIDVPVYQVTTDEGDFYKKKNFLMLSDAEKYKEKRIAEGYEADIDETEIDYSDFWESERFRKGPEHEQSALEWVGYER